MQKVVISNFIVDFQEEKQPMFWICQSLLRLEPLKQQKPREGYQKIKGRSKIASFVEKSTQIHVKKVGWAGGYLCTIGYIRRFLQKMDPSKKTSYTHRQVPIAIASKCEKRCPSF